MKNYTLFLAQLNMEGYSINRAHEIIKVEKTGFDIEEIEGSEETEGPMVIFLKENGNTDVFYNQNLGQHIKKAINSISRDVIFETAGANVVQVMNGPDQYEAGHYVTRCFDKADEHDFNNAIIVKDSNSELLNDLPGIDKRALPLYGMLEEGRLVSYCLSSRENEKSGEAWAYSDPEYRKKGYAKKVTKLWAHHLIKNSKIPFYTYERSNMPSEKLAESLGLEKMFETISLVKKH